MVKNPHGYWVLEVFCQWGRIQLKSSNASPDFSDSYYRFTYPIRTSLFGYRIRTISFYNENKWNLGYNPTIDVQYDVLCRHGIDSHIEFTVFRENQFLNPLSYDYQTNVDFYVIG